MKCLLTNCLFAVTTVALASAGVVSTSAAIADANRPVGESTPKVGSLEFPRDHGNHPAYGRESWLFTGHVTTEDGHWFAYQVNFRRIDVPGSGDTIDDETWDVRSIYPVSMALTDLMDERFIFRERLERSGAGTTTTREGSLDISSRGWHAGRADTAWALTAFEDGVGVDLVLEPVRRIVPEPPNGTFTDDAENGRRGIRYSMPGLSTEGRIVLSGDTLVVSGLSWFDHIYGDGLMAKDEVGWDWLNLQLRDGSAISVHRFRCDFGDHERRVGGSYISASGATIPLTDLALRLYPKGARRWTASETGASYPLRWHIEIPSLGLVLDADAHVAGQTLPTWRTHGTEIWRGSMAVDGLRGRHAISGAGFLEMTGYAGPFPPSISKEKTGPDIALR